MTKLSNEEIEEWIILMSHLNRRRGGITWNDVFSVKDRYPKVEINKVTKSFQDLIAKKLIEEDKDSSIDGLHYTLTEDGKKRIAKITSDDVKFIRLIKLAPPEYELRYRISDIEYSIFYAFLSFAFYYLSMLAVKGGHIRIGLSLVSLTFFSIGLTASAIGRVFAFPILDLSNMVLGKTYGWLDKKEKFISTIITIAILGILFLGWYSYDKTNFLSNIWLVCIGLVISGAAGLIWFRSWILKGLQQVRNYLKSYLE